MLARRTERMNPSIIREILKLTERPDLVSLAGGLPAPEGFPVAALAAASARVFAEAPTQALQYATSEGLPALREWIAASVARLGIDANPDQVLITNGSQQGLDLCARLFVDPGSPVLVESPTYLGALQAFAPFEPRFVAVASDDDGPLPDALRDSVRRGAPGFGARLLYLVPDFQNPTGRSIAAERRTAIARIAADAGIAIVEDNPYRDLWFDAPPGRALASFAPEATIHLGSFSKILAPGLRLGYAIAPADLYPKLLQAKQACDLHSSGLSQRIAAEVLHAGLLEHHMPTVRSLYRTRRDAMAAALTRDFGQAAQWRLPAGGMFFWLSMRDGQDLAACLPAAIAAGVSYVPGTAFHVGETQGSASMRLGFATATPERIGDAIARLATVVKTAPARASGER